MGRKLGQHFLTDPAILDRIVDALDPRPTDVVLEIGAGRGTLTKRLVGRVGLVVAVETDADLVELLEREYRVQSTEYRVQGGEGRVQGTEGGAQSTKDRVQSTEGENGAGSGSGTGHVSVVHADALRVDWGRLVAEQTLYSVRCTLTNHKVIGNIPYYITSPLIDKALTPPLPERIVFLVQKEVAERLAAVPGGKTYGALTVGVQAVADVEHLFTVKRGTFNPPPAVDSAVVRITPKDEPLVAPDEQPRFRVFVQALFSRRRKQIAGIMRSVAALDQDRAIEVLARVGVDPQARPETLSPATTVQLFRAVTKAAG